MLDPRPIPTRNGTFHALVAGPEDGPLVLCLHGFPDTARTYEPLLPLLAAAGHRVVAPWLRGYHPSPLAGPYHAGQIADDALAIADALSPDRPIALVGHDWGALGTYHALVRAPGRIHHAVTLAIPHPLAILRNAPRHPGQLRRSWYAMFFQLPLLPERAVPWRGFALIDKLWRDWSPGFTAPAEHLADVKRCLERSMPAPIAYYRSEIRRALGGARFPAEKIRVPTLCLHGERDGCMAAGLGDGQERGFAGPFRGEVLPGVGHFLHLEAPGAIAERVLGWISVMD